MYRFKYYKYIHITNTHILIFARWVKWIQTIHESRFPSPASTPVPLVLGRQNSIVYYKILLASAHIVAVLAGWFYGCSPGLCQKIWSVDFECSDKCMVLRCFLMFSAQRFQLRSSKIVSQVLRVSCHDLGPSAVNLAVHSNPQSCHPASGNSCD